MANTPDDVAALPSVVTEGSGGHLQHTGAVHRYLKQIAGDINDEFSGKVSSAEVDDIVKMAEVDYDGLATKPTNRLYFTVEVATPISVTLEPADQTVTEPNTATFTADMTNINMQRWQIMFTDGRIQDILEAGADTKTFTTSARDAARDNGKKYRMVGWHSERPDHKVETRWATLTVNPNLAVTSPDVAHVTFNDFATTSIGTSIITPLRAAFDAITPTNVNWENIHGQIIDLDGARVLRHKSPTDSIKKTQYPIYFTGGPSYGGWEELYLSFRVYIEPGFSPGTTHNGGKMFGGLCGGTIAGASYPPSGGKGADGTDGFSARLNWGDPSYSDMTTRYWVAYTYHPDRTHNKPYGDQWQFGNGSFQYETGRWYTVTQRVKMNTAQNYDGILEWWVDGVKMVSRTNLRWRTTGQFSVNCLYLSNFHGGGAPASLPTRDSFWRIDDIKVATVATGVDGLA